MPKFPPAVLERLAVRVFQAAGVPVGDARLVAQHLVAANLAGHDSHGILRLPQYVEALRYGRVKVGVEPEITNQTATTAVLNGRGAFGQVVAHAATTLVMAKARQQGVAAVTFCNSYHSGRIASYTERAAAEGLVAIAMVNAGGGGQAVAPFGGLARRLATNPLSIAAPFENGRAVVLDLASSVAPEGKLRHHLLRKERIPEGWLIDARGRPSTNPKDFYDSPGGALLPVGGPVGYKGFGLAFLIDILAGALSGAGCCRPGNPEPKDGLLILALDVARFIPLKAFHRHVALLIEHVKSCPPAPGFREVLVPGEREAREERRRRAEGIEVDAELWRQIQVLGQELGLRVGAKAWPAFKSKARPAQAAPAAAAKSADLAAPAVHQRSR